MLKQVALRPIREAVSDYDEVEKKIIALLKRTLYLPLLRQFSESAQVLRNAKFDLLRAIQSGRITFNRGTFSGRFNSTISKELKAIGAKWDRTEKAWKLPTADLPQQLQHAISSSEFRYQQKMQKIDEALSKLVPEGIADQIRVSEYFDSALWKVDNDFRKSVKGFAMPANLSDAQRKKIADEWQNNLKLWIKDFTEAQIKKLREEMQASVFAGNRYGSAIEHIKTSYGVTRRKAKFLARQETSLLMAKFKETRYLDAGVTKYKWKSVTGSPLHPVRPMHKELNDRSAKGELFDFRSPPVDDPNGSRHNPGENYNCRCVAIPVVTF